MLKAISILLILLGLFMIGRFIMLGASSGEMNGPSGIVDGRLSECPDSPNCVNSEYSNADSYIAPLSYPVTGKQGLLEAIAITGGEVQSNQNNYVSATYRIPVFGFIDDVEFRLDASDGIIHVRSASRSGYSDLGVNQRRVRKIRRALEK